MKEYVLTDKDIEYLKKALYSPKTFPTRDPNLPQESIMTYESDCSCDDGFFCEHRLEWLINYIESKGIKTRKIKLDRLK